MATLHTKFYFLIYPRTNSDEEIAEAVVSIQDFTLNNNLHQITEEGETDLISPNYVAAVEYLNVFRKEASVTITRKTPNGSQRKIYNLDFNSCDVYKDEDFIIAFGIGDFELPTTGDPVEDKAITKRNVARVKKLTNLKSLEMISKKQLDSNEDQPSV